MNFLIVKTLWREKKGFELDRKTIGDMYIFIKYHTPVTAILHGEKVNIKQGGCVFFAPNKPQHFYSKETSLIHDWFHAETEWCRRLLDKYSLETEVVYYPQNTTEITDMIKSIELEYIKKEPYYEEVSSALAQKLFASLSRSKNTDGQYTYSNKEKECFENAREEIHLRFKENWNVSKMAQLVSLSESRFFYIYKKIFGISPIKDLLNTKIARAQMLLISTDLSVEEISTLSGFNNHFHFIRTFKKFAEITPGRFREKNK